MHTHILIIRLLFMYNEWKKIQRGIILVVGRNCVGRKEGMRWDVGRNTGGVVTLKYILPKEI